MGKFSLRGKTAVITGGASGIGRAICEVFAEAGALVHIVDLEASKGNELSGFLNVDERRAIFQRCDITDQSAVAALFSQIHEAGPINILINNAGIAHVGSASGTAREDFEKVMRVNVHGAYHTLHACLPYMIEDGGGSIVNIASTVASVAIPDRFAYMTSKGALLSMTYSVAIDYIDSGIRCNAISPGRVHTPFVDGFIARNYPGKEAEMFEKLSMDHPIGRMAKPVEIADLALYLCSDEAAYVTGSNHEIDGGFTKLKTK
ncbi:MAG: SDR family oxidoreductase [Saprospiraceae bacterium]|nr:SDR family oxidoreductase [Saprospiraceae bacterium]